MAARKQSPAPETTETEERREKVVISLTSDEFKRLRLAAIELGVRKETQLAKQIVLAGI